MIEKEKSEKKTPEKKTPEKKVPIFEGDFSHRSREISQKGGGPKKPPIKKD